MNILLTDAEIKKAIEAKFPFMYPQEAGVCRLIAKAQLKRVATELKDLIESRGNFDHNDHPFNTNPNKDTRWHFSMWIPQDEWDSIWQALLKEVEDGR